MTEFIVKLNRLEIYEHLSDFCHERQEAIGPYLENYSYEAWANRALAGTLGKAEKSDFLNLVVKGFWWISEDSDRVGSGPYAIVRLLPVNDKTLVKVLDMGEFDYSIDNPFDEARTKHCADFCQAVKARFAGLALLEEFQSEQAPAQQEKPIEIRTYLDGSLGDIDTNLTEFCKEYHGNSKNIFSIESFFRWIRTDSKISFPIMHLTFTPTGGIKDDGPFGEIEITRKSDNRSEMRCKIFDSDLASDVQDYCQVIINKLSADFGQQASRPEIGPDGQQKLYIESVRNQLENARRALAILEQQAAGYTSLTMPVHLQIDLESKRKEVEKLENALSQWLGR